jgi:hypothetical protein
VSAQRGLRDEFPKKVKSALALRAAYKCSLCDGPTVGPSDESPMSVAMTGRAAHIAAAAPNGPRCDEAMTADQRKAFDNGIWLCANHADLVDDDRATYTVSGLKTLKLEHERRCQAAQASLQLSGGVSAQLLAFGPSVVAVGELVRVAGDSWTVDIEHFVAGSFNELVQLAEGFGATPAYDRFVVVNSIGDGRALAAAPVVERFEGAVRVTVTVFPSFPRATAQSLGRDFAVSAAHDLFAENGAIAEVSGLSALPQKILSILSMRLGESPFYRDFGSRFSEYFELFAGSPWLDQLLKLEVVRLAAVPYADPVLGTQYTPFQCINQVRAVSVLGMPANNRVPVRFDLEVAGVGPWSRDLAIFV